MMIDTARLTFFTLDNGKVGFRGMVRGLRRCIVADTTADLYAFIGREW